MACMALIRSTLKLRAIKTKIVLVLGKVSLFLPDKLHSFLVSIPKS